jgi:hypothetical protein
MYGGGAVLHNRVVGTAASTSSLGRTIQLGCPRDVALRFCIMRKSHRQDIEFGRVMTGRIRMHNETAGEIAIQSQIERDNGFLGLDCRHGRVAPHSRRPECGDYQNNLATHRIEPDPERAPIIVKLFEWYASGEYSLKALTKKAAAVGLTNRTGGTPLVKAKIHQLLQNPIYYGESTG